MEGGIESSEEYRLPLRFDPRAAGPGNPFGEASRRRRPEGPARFGHGVAPGAGGVYSARQSSM